MRRPAPIENEIMFGLEEMFFSTTDHQGTILDSNEIFRKISRYSRDEIIGSPHSIIRHPDMPKIVFKTLWDNILSGKPICAYLKNLAKDGSFYWVFATFIPIGENFLSIRMKPTTEFKDTVEGLYKDLLKAEASSGAEGSLKVLTSALGSLGFPDYESFALTTIAAELTNRHALQLKLPPKIEITDTTTFLVNHRDLEKVRESLFSIFTLINKLSTHSQAISDVIIKIEDVSKRIEYSALNTIIEADRLGEDGRALAVVAQYISAGAAEAKKLNSIVNQLVTKMLGNLGDFRATQFAIALSTLQVEMLSCLVDQWQSDPTSMTEENFKTTYLMLTNLTEASLNQARPVISSLGEDSHRISMELFRTSQVLLTLDFVQKAGSIESARLDDSNIFSHLFSTIMNLTKESKALYGDFSKIINDVIGKDVDDTIKQFETLSQSIYYIHIR